MARTVHRPWHPELRGRLDITRDDETLRLRLDPSLVPGREDVVGRLHEATGPQALRELGHETVTKIVGHLHQEYKQLSYDSRDAREAVGVTLAALVVHLQDEGVGHSLSPEIMETVSRLIDDGVGRETLSRMSVVSAGRQRQVIEERRRGITETREAITSMFEAPAEASGERPSFEESVDRLRGVVSEEGGSLREQARALAGGLTYAVAVRDGVERGLEEERQRLDEEIASVREKKTGVEAALESGQEELSALKPRGFVGFFIGLYNEVREQGRLKEIRAGIAESRGSIAAAGREEVSLTAQEAELNRRREDAEEVLAAFRGRRLHAARGLIGEMGEGYRMLSQDVREFDGLRPELDDAMIRRVLSPVLAQMTGAGVLSPELAREYETLMRESMREGFYAVSGMPEEVRARVTARGDRMREIKDNVFENAKERGLHEFYGVLSNIRERLQHHGYPVSAYDGMLEVLVSEAGFRDIQAVAGRLMSQDLTDGERRGLEGTVRDVVSQGRSEWRKEFDIPLDITASSIKQMQERLGGKHAEWEVVSENPTVKAIVGEGTTASAEGRIATTVVDRLLTTREHTDESNHMGWLLLDYRTDDTIPFTIMNCFRETGHNGEMPFISTHVARAEETEVYRYVASLTEDELAHLRGREIPGLTEVVTLVRMTTMTPEELREVAAGPPSSVRETAAFFVRYPEAQRDFRRRSIDDPMYVRLERAYNRVPTPEEEWKDTLSLEDTTTSIRKRMYEGHEMTAGQTRVFERRLAVACRETGLDADVMRETALRRSWGRPDINNPFHAAMEENLGAICLHLMVEGDDRQKVFVLGLLERLDTDLSRHYDVMSKTLQDTGSERVQSEIVDSIRRRTGYHDGASAARVITGGFERMNPSAKKLVTYSEEVVDGVFKALLPQPLTGGDVSALSAITGRPEEEFRQVNALIVGVNRAYDHVKEYHHFHPEYRDFDTCLTIARSEGAQELVEALIPYGFELEVDHAPVIGQMTDDRERILAGVRMLSQLIPDYRYRPHRDYLYNPETETSEPVFTVEPYAAFAKSQNMGRLFQVLNEVRVTHGGIPMKITDGLHASLLPAGAESSGETRREFNNAVARLSQAFSDGPLAGAEELLTPALLRRLAENPLLVSGNITAFGPYLSEQIEALKAKPSLSFIQAADATLRLLNQPVKSLELICGAGYPAGFVLGVLGAFEPGELTPELTGRLVASIPRNCPLVKDEYNLEYCASYVHVHRTEQTRILAGAVGRFHPLTKENTVDLLSVMSFADSLTDAGFHERVLAQLNAGHGSFREFVGGVNGEAVAVLSDRYPATLLAEQSPDRMLRWLKVYSTYEQTLKHFRKPDKIPLMRAIAVVELMGEEERFKRNDPELLKALADDAETLFPKEDERAAAVAYLTKRMEGADAKAVFPDGSFTNEDRTRLIGIFQDPAHAFSHTLSDVCVDDRIESVWRLLDDLFHKRHFSPALQALEALHPEGPNPMQVLGDEWRVCDLTVRRISGGGEEGGRKKRGKENPTLEAAAGRLQEEVAHLPQEQQVARLRERQREIEREQEHMRTWAGIRGLGVKYDGKLEEITEAITGAREQLGEHAPLIEELGFRFDESFRKKVYRGDIDLLSAALDKNLAMSGQKEELQALQGIIADLKKTYSDGEQYISGLAPTLSETLGMLETKRTHVREIQAGIRPEDGFEEALEKVRSQDPRVAGYIEKIVRDDGVPAKEQRALLDRTLTEYEDSSAIEDVRALMTLIAGEAEGRAGEPVVHAYRHEQVFSMMLEAMRGQCLDYRTSHNSIGNSVYNISLMDAIRALDVSYDQDGRPRFDSITYLSPVTIDGVEQPAIVTDPFYVPDGSVTSWSKIEGHILHMLEKANRMGIPLVVPASHISANEQMFTDMQAEAGKPFERRTAQVRIIPGPTGETYCELTGYTHYTQDTAQTVEAYVYTPKQATAQATVQA